MAGWVLRALRLSTRASRLVAGYSLDAIQPAARYPAQRANAEPGITLAADR
jgi:hypothetical protein